MPSTNYDGLMTQGVRVLTSYCGDEAGQTTDLHGIGNITLTLPVAFVKAPSLQFHGWLHWKISGQMTTDLAACAQTWRMIDNGSVIAGFPGLTTNIAVQLTNAQFLFEADIVVLGNHDQQDKQLYRHTLTMISGAEALVIADTQYQLLTLAQRTDHQLGFTLAITGDDASPAFDTKVYSVNCVHFAPRSDS